MMKNYFLNENKDRMMIALFEVFKPYRDRGLGKRIIAQFLQDYYGEVNLEPSGTTSKPQKSRSSWEYFRNMIRSVSVGIEKICWIRSALSIG